MFDVLIGEVEQKTKLKRSFQEEQNLKKDESWLLYVLIMQQDW